MKILSGESHLQQRQRQRSPAPGPVPSVPCDCRGGNEIGSGIIGTKVPPTYSPIKKQNATKATGNPKANKNIIIQTSPKRGGTYKDMTPYMCRPHSFYFTVQTQRTTPHLSLTDGWHKHCMCPHQRFAQPLMLTIQHSSQNYP